MQLLKKKINTIFMGGDGGGACKPVPLKIETGTWKRRLGW